MPARKQKTPTTRKTRVDTPKPAAARKTTVSRNARPKTDKPARTDVFISYSHVDKEWLDRLQVHLKPLMRGGDINIWADTRIKSGDRWEVEIKKALAKAKVAILLVSPDFLASDFIHNEELPPLLHAAEKEGLTLLNLIVSSSGGFWQSPISAFQAINEPKQALNILSRGQVDEVLSQVHNRVHELFQAPASKPKSRSAVRSSGEMKLTRPVKADTGKAAGGKKTPARSVATGKAALLVKQSGEWAVVTVRSSSVHSQLSMELSTTDPAVRVFLSTVRTKRELAGLVLGLQTYVCSNVEIHQKTEGTKQTWHLQAEVQEPNRRAGVSYNGVTPAMQAEVHARLLLLNEPLPKTGSPFGFVPLGTLPFDKSPLPALFQQGKRRKAAFEQAAPLVAVWFLQMSGIVEHLLRLSLTLTGNVSKVRFEGQRSGYYGESPISIRVEGTCNLSAGVTDDLPLRLPVSRH